MITMSGTIATLFMGFGSILLRNIIPSKDWYFLVPAFITLMLEVLFTTFVIKYSLDAYKLKDNTYFNLLLPKVLQHDSKQNIDVIKQINEAGLRSFIKDMIVDYIIAIPTNSLVNEKKMEKVVRSQQLFLCALIMVPIFAGIVIYKSLT